METSIEKLLKSRIKLNFDRNNFKAISNQHQNQYKNEKGANNNQ
jgi:hypothetical protein